MGYLLFMNMGEKMTMDEKTRIENHEKNLLLVKEEKKELQKLLEPYMTKMKCLERKEKNIETEILRLKTIIQRRENIATVKKHKGKKTLLDTIREGAEGTFDDYEYLSKTGKKLILGSDLSYRHGCDQKIAICLEDTHSVLFNFKEAKEHYDKGWQLGYCNGKIEVHYLESYTNGSVRPETIIVIGKKEVNE